MESLCIKEEKWEFSDLLYSIRLVPHYFTFEAIEHMKQSKQMFKYLLRERMFQ